MFWLELLVVLICIYFGARIGGLGLGVMGGLGLSVLTFVFHLKPTSAPIDVILMIAAVITAAGAMQAAGGMDYLVQLAEKMLRKNPSRITFMGPLVTYLFTFFAGTGHVAYSVMPVIAEVATESGVRPERPMSIAAIASQQAITASPISAATVALLGLLGGYNIQLVDIMKICVPATFLGCMIAAFVCSKMGKELKDDPEYQRRVAAGLIKMKESTAKKVELKPGAKLSVILFVVSAILIVLLGTFPELRPVWPVAGAKPDRLSMPSTIEMVMLSIAALIIIFSKVKVEEIVKGNVFQAGVTAVIGIFGIAWMGDTFFSGNMDLLTGSIKDMVTSAPWLFALALFLLSVLLYSQAATVRTLMPLGLSLGLGPAALIAMFPAVNGYFFIPNYPTIVAAINFDRTGTTRIGKYILNHSFMVPGIVATVSAVVIGFGLAQLFL
ncbi:anaerobic C4-dicarboxylate transporter family protein [Brevibacillus ginsengisoli]|uniref:anaerobic C4-dicarboxylate transporter family protein n=1 Tax=Brevibacillus ginsengisoli TaxID=363854 RepID=UPI003CEA6BC6